MRHALPLPVRSGSAALDSSYLRRPGGVLAHCVVAFLVFAAFTVGVIAFFAGMVLANRWSPAMMAAGLACGLAGIGLLIRVGELLCDTDSCGATNLGTLLLIAAAGFAVWSAWDVVRAWQRR